MRVLLGLAVALLLDTLVQLSWKWTASGLLDGGAHDIIMAVLHRPYPLVVIALMILQMINWLKLLAHVDLSFAQPITALSYISVCLLSVLLFAEDLGRYQIIGIGCIIVGVWFVSRTEHRSDDPVAAMPRELEP